MPDHLVHAGFADRNGALYALKFGLYIDWLEMRVMQAVAEDLLIVLFLPNGAPRRQLERADSLYREADVELLGGEAIVKQRVGGGEVQVLGKVLLGLQEVLARET